MGDGPEAIVSVGAGLTLVVVHERGALQFVRTIDLGGDSTTRSIAGALDLPESDAEVVKRALGTDAANLDPMARSAVQEAIDELVTEILNSVRFYAAQPGRRPVSRLLVTGGGAQTDGFLSELQRASSVPVVLASPLSMTDTSRLPITAEEAAAIDPTLAVPVGLALSDPTGRPFNLLPSEVVARATERKVKRGLLVGAGGVAVLLIGLSAWRITAVNSAKDQVASLTSQIHVIKTVEIPKYNKAVQLKNSVAALQKEPLPVLSNEVNWLVVLNQISKLQPSNAVVGGLSMAAVPPAAAPAPAPTTKSGTTSKTPAPTTPSASETIATVSTTVTVPDLNSVTIWGQSMNSGTVLTDVLPNGTLAPGPGGVAFTASISVTGQAQSQRLTKFEEPLP
jgi:type IV pilus assembly protein PilM